MVMRSLLRLRIRIMGLLRLRWTRQIWLRRWAKREACSWANVFQASKKGTTGAAGAAAFFALNKAQPDYITNLALFGLDRSDGDLTWKWSSVGDLISERNDPARPPVRGWNKKFLHWRLRRAVENIYFRIFTFILIFGDISIVITEMVISCSGNPVSIILRHVDLILSTYFLIEVIYYHLIW